MVTYHFKARLRDDRTGHIGNYCDQGGDTTIRIYVNPVPKINVVLNDTLFCNNAPIQDTSLVRFTISTPTIAIGSMKYNLNTTPSNTEGLWQ